MTSKPLPISKLSEGQRDLALQILSESKLTWDEDAEIRSAKIDFSEGVGFGLRSWVAAARGISYEDAREVI